MALLIDGYNLLHASGILPRGIGPGTLERSRNALLNFLAEAIEPGELKHTTVVFDANDAPPGLPRAVEFHGMSVRFATQYENADELIEELIKADTSPRKLVVVSSDHRLHRAARRRRATPVDSDKWYAEMLRRRASGASKSPDGPSKPTGPTNAGEVEFWLRQFGEVDSPSAPSTKPADADAESRYPFPPGYGDDLLEEDR